MTEGDQVTLRQLPEGIPQEAVISSAQGRMLELRLGVGSNEFRLGSPAEIQSPEAIFLGVVERRQDQRLWIQVEHLLDREILADIQASWKE